MSMAMLRLMSGNLAKARQIGAQLKAAREAADMTPADVARDLGVYSSTIGRWEKGERKQKVRDLRRYLEAVSATPELIAEIVDLAEADDASPWLAVGLPAQRRQLDALVKVESTASEIISMSPLLVPGILQTRDYALAIMRLAKVPERELHTRVAVRLGRREAITRAQQPARLLVLIGESVLTRPIGGPAIMVDQLRYLSDIDRRDNVELRIIPHNADWNASLEGSFVLVKSPDGTAVVQHENRRSALFYHDPEDVVAYQEAVDNVLEIAMNPADSAGFIEKTISDWS